MAIRPKIGELVGLKTWEIRNGKAVPPSPWTGQVIGIDRAPRKTIYHIKRTIDGEIVRETSCFLYRPSQGAER